jgi:hypothetical protein
MKTSHYCVLLALLGVAACGNGGGGGNKASVEKQEIAEASPGTYYAILRPVNFHSNGFIPYGSATFTVEGDKLQVNTTMDDDSAVTHRQSLHMGTRCPTQADDANGDGLVDYNEAMKVVGPVLMPLDNDISSQLAGAEVYPRGTGMTYNKTASLTAINTDLSKSDENPSDEIAKTPGRGIGFDGRVVLAHGTSQSALLPTSLAARGGETANISLPVVCGVLRKL